jgi:DNA primase
MNVTEEIKQRLDIVDLIGSSGVQLRKAGRNFTGFCPFHPNARTPAFYVFPDTQSYYCFSCHKSGDAFTYVMEKDGLPFGDALVQLAGRAGVPLPERDAASREAREQESVLEAKLRQINEDAAVYWNHLLRNTAKGAPGRAYVEQRGLNEAALETWQLGYAPEDWSDLLRYLTNQKNHQPEEIEQAGLVIRREGGGYYDRFRNRLMFPIRDLKGSVVGFGGRALGDDHAKYMNTPETPVFHKSSLLFGLHQAREGIRAADNVVIVEGYLDVITAHQAGFGNVVAPMGTALTAEQVQVIRKLTANLYLALDQDAAGIRAAEKGVDSILQTSAPQLVVRGRAMEWAVDLDLAVRIIRLPEGKDPDDIIKADPDQWRTAIANALPIIDFFFDMHTRGRDFSNPDHQQRALSALAPVVVSIKDFARRAVYTSRLADLLRMPLGLVEASLLDVTRQNRRAAQGSTMARTQRPATSPTAALDPFEREDYLLSLLMRFPKPQERVYERVQDTLASALEGFPDLQDDIPNDLGAVFGRVENRLLWQSWNEYGPGGPPDVAAWLHDIDDALRPHAERLLAWQDAPPLSKIAPLGDVRDRASGIAQTMRQAVAKRRRDEMKEMSRYVEDEQDQKQLARKLQLVLDYFNVVTAPRRSTVFQDLNSRREEFG